MAVALAKVLRTGRLKAIGIHYAHGKVTLSATPIGALDELIRALAACVCPEGRSCRSATVAAGTATLAAHTADATAGPQRAHSDAPARR